MPSFKTWWERSYSGRQERVSLHVLFWLAYLCFLSSTAYEHLRISSPLPIPINLLIWLTPFYLIWVYYFFIHTAYQFFQRQKSGMALLMVVAALLIYVNSDILFTYLQIVKFKAEGIPSKFEIADFNSFYLRSLLSWSALFHFLFGFTIYLVLPVLCKFFRDLQRSQQQYRELSERNMQLELNLIKSQVNPHFLLNTLNNIYGISIAGSRQQIGEMILNLSGFLKYSLYECNNEFVEVSKEIRLIENYIELEEVRSDFIDVGFELNIDSEKYFIPPFILFPLVENAFKHGTKNLTRPTFILMALTIENGKLDFRIENDLQTTLSENGGFGLPALRKKIEYYYPNNSEFNSQMNGGRYIAQLQISGLCQTLPA